MREKKNQCNTETRFTLIYCWTHRLIVTLIVTLWSMEQPTSRYYKAAVSYRPAHGNNHRALERSSRPESGLIRCFAMFMFVIERWTALNLTLRSALVASSRNSENSLMTSRFDRQKIVFRLVSFLKPRGFYSIIRRERLPGIKALPFAFYCVCKKISENNFFLSFWAWVIDIQRDCHDIRMT